MDLPKDATKGPELEFIRSQFVIEAFTGLFFITSMVIPIAVYKWVSTGFEQSIAIQLGSVVILFLIWTRRNNIKPRVLASILLLILGAAGASIVLKQGFHTVGFLFLMFFAFTASLSFGLRGTIAGGMAVFTLLATGWFLHVNGFVQSGINPLTQSKETSAWIIQTWSLLILIGWLSIPTTRLLNRVQALALEKEKQSELAQMASQAKSAFLANMSHEIRTPMNGVVGMAEMLSQTALSDDQKRKLHTIQDSSQALLSIIDDILDFSKIEAGKLEVENRKAIVVEELERVCNTIRPIAEDKNVRLHLSLTPDVMGAIESDPARLRQILMNLLGNAVKFSSGRIGKSGQIELHCERSVDGDILFEVSDNGIGMSEETMQGLFVPFTQAEAGITRKFGGTGLGLSIARSLAQLLGGTISVESQIDVGSKFTLKLPYVPLPDKLKTPDLSGLTIFAYIDDQASCDSIGEFVRLQGSEFVKFDDLQVLIERGKDAGSGTIVMVAQENLAANFEVIEKLYDVNPGIKILNAVTSPLEMGGDISPNCFRLLRFPLLPSEFVRGLLVLSNRSPDQVGSMANKPAVTNPSNLRILVVEDNPTNLLVITTQLKSLGLSADTASDGVEGFEAYSSADYDLVLSDCHMPNMDGFEMTRMIRKFEQERGRAEIPVIALTADAIKGIEERCEDAGMNGVLTKPVKISDLQNALEANSPLSD